MAWAVFLDGPIAGEIRKMPHLSPRMVIPLPPGEEQFWDNVDNDIARDSIDTGCQYHLVFISTGSASDKVGMYSEYGDAIAVLRYLRAWMVRNSNDAFLRAVTGGALLCPKAG